MGSLQVSFDASNAEVKKQAVGNELNPLNHVKFSLTSVSYLLRIGNLLPMQFIVAISISVIQSKI